MASNEPAIDSVQADQLRSYDAAAATSTTLDSYLESLHQEYESMHAATDFEAWQTDRNITDNELETVKDILDTVDEETLGAYSMTELFPQEGRNRMEREQAAMKNEATYDYMLEHGGEEFVELIPAQYDSYLSFGPFQLTSWVVRGDHRVGSANSMNDYVPSRFEVPGSMKDVEGDDHIHAVYGLLAHQTTDLARELGEEKTGRLDSLDADDVALLAAGLHHRPQSTKRNVVSWASEDSSGVFGVEDLPSVSGYVSETGVNYDVLSSNRHLQRRSIKDYFSKVAEDKEWRVYRVAPSLQDRHPSVIASYFDVLDSNRGDLCDNTGNLNVVDGKHDLSVYDGSGKRWFKARCD